MKLRCQRLGEYVHDQKYTQPFSKVGVFLPQRELSLHNTILNPPPPPDPARLGEVAQPALLRLQVDILTGW